MEFLNEPKSDRSYIFNNIKTALKHSVRMNWFSLDKHCVCCGELLTLRRNKNFLNRVCFFCRICKKTFPLFSNKNISSPKINLNIYMLSVFKWLENGYEKDVLRNLNISKGCYQKIKAKIAKFICLKINDLNNTKIGGNKRKVQIDETAICHGFLSSCPSKLSDDFPGVTWLIGAIEEGTNRVKYQILNDRTVESIKNFITNNILENTTIITDGHASYPRAILENRCTHIVVNHSLGFRNADGFSSNSIENFWSLLKYEIKKRKGVLKRNLKKFLDEYIYRYSFLRARSMSEIMCAFNEIMIFLFSDESD